MFGKSALRSSGFVDLNQTSAFPARLLCCLAFTWLGRAMAQKTQTDQGRPW